MMKFKLGEVVMTQGIAENITRTEILAALKRHASGDWGDVCKSDKKENDFAVKNGLRILSSYRTAKGEKFWIITEADRSSTTVLLPEEY